MNAMNLKSKDGKTTITRWDAEWFRWVDQDGDQGNLYRNPDTGVVTQWGHAFQPPEALDWLNGQTEPPPPKIKEGDRVVVHHEGVVTRTTEQTVIVNGWSVDRSWVTLAGDDE